MLVALAVSLGALLALVLYKIVSKIVSKRSSHAAATVTLDTTPAFDQFLRSSLEQLLASYVLGFANSTVHERAGIRRTLAGEPDPDVVTKIEQLVKSVELEFVRYTNEPDVEATVRVRYEDGRLAVRTQRLPVADIPMTVLSELETKKSPNVFRTWTFPWQTPDTVNA